MYRYFRSRDRIHQYYTVHVAAVGGSSFTFRSQTGSLLAPIFDEIVE